MENKKKMIFNVLFSLSCLCGNTLWSVPWRGFKRDCRNPENSEFILVASGCCLCDYLYLGRVNYYIFYMMHTLGIHLKKWKCFLFSSGFFFQLYHTIRNRWAAGAALLYEQRENSNPGINACIDDCHDYL